MTRFHIADMSCGHCRATIEKTVTDLDDDAELEFDMETREVAIDASIPLDALKAALASAGYPAAEI